MEFSGPGTLADVEEDLALSDEDVELHLSQNHWPRITTTGSRKLAPVDAVPRPMDHAPISTKRHIEHDLDSSSEPLSPAAKTTRCEAPNYYLPRPAIQSIRSLATPVFPAFAPEKHTGGPVTLVAPNPL
ncbi:hypothetical protein Pcinc_002948 [Petrolisthes cinctipes]|uniref:Uncharacterized protein n=1 Tax=Petrolisthes cinctipes TaxID=88211 RepID=A0AAE1GHQ8_PETCI|nr:hypothetical protein Pcinc_002948 [Petrolisthes cinctipes]